MRHYLEPGRGEREVTGEWKGREGGGNGGLTRRPGGLAARAAGLAAEVLFGSAALRIWARHCRVKIGGAAEPCHVIGHDSDHRHVSPLPHHHGWRGTGIWPRQGNRRGQKC